MAESPAQAKARLRRERLAAKSGASRLQQITALQGGPPRSLSEQDMDVPVNSSRSTPSAFPPSGSGTASADPDEVDISQHHFSSISTKARKAQPNPPSRLGLSEGSTGPFGPGPTPDGAEDPMVAMLQQMMSSNAGGAGQPSSAPGDLPPGLANLFSAMNGGAGMDPSSSPSPAQTSAWAWRLVHSLLSLALAVHIVWQTPFTGSRLSRDVMVIDGNDWTQQPRTVHGSGHLFYLFATLELVLQSSRFFVEKGQLQGSGILSTAAGILPAPYSGYLQTLGRYSVIYSTVVSDAMVVVFVLGVSSWWRGAAVA